MKLVVWLSGVGMAATIAACQTAAPPREAEGPPPAERSFTRPAADPNAASAQFAKQARARGCDVEELATGVLAHCPDAMIAVQPHKGATSNDLLIECRDMTPAACAPIFDGIVNGDAAPSASASPSASAPPAESAAPASP